MRQAAATLLVLCYLGLGSGVIEHWHNAHHAAEDARTLAAAREAGNPLDHLPLHDDSNCPFHAQLHLSFISAGWTPVLICLGVFVAFLSLLERTIARQRVVIRIPCRGPPVG